MEQLVFKRWYGDLEVWAEEDGTLIVDWFQPTDESRSNSFKIEFSPYEMEQILWLIQKVQRKSVRHPS
jgi:hypothetical protein